MFLHNSIDHRWTHDFAAGPQVYEQEVAENNPDLTDEVAIRVAMTKAKNEAANAAAAAAASVGTTAKTPV